MKINKALIVLSFFAIASINYAQPKQKSNSDARQFIENAEITQINKDWNIKAELKLLIKIK